MSSVQESSQKSPTWILETALHPDAISLRNSIPVSIKSLQTTIGHLSNNGKQRERNSHRIWAKILQKLYRNIAPRAAQIQPHQTLLEEEKLFQQEIDDIVKKIPIGKVPGCDGIDNIIVKVILNSFPSLLLDFFNKCLELTCYPDPLKIGLVILFHKTGKEEHNIKSYRPISLLPTLGKLLEKLLLQRFSFQLKTNKLQHPLQYRFREGKSADDALLHVTSLLEQARRQETLAVLISLDISGAFDSLQYSSIRDRFASLSLFSNISETLLDTLRNRKVAMQTSEGPVLWEQTRTTPTAALQVVTGLQPLYLQIQQEATYARVSRARSSSNFFTVIFSPTDYESKSSGIRIHPPPNFLLHSQISFAENDIDSGVNAIYTDGSKTDEGTGSAYCILENYGIIASWQGKLDRSNSVFQAEILAIRMAIEAASSLHRPIKIRTDSLSSLMAILNPKSHHSIVREIQTLLLSHKHIHLRWLKAHVGYLGNECADQLAKEAITKGDPFLLPKPLSYLKAEIKSAALSIWQDNWDSGETGRSTHDIVPRVSNKPVG
ncbi:hypothetical protein AVEN_84240-1 [Araneus ventricosus]|uniref:RNase H type-1 domain-containing protein n=1 Tax=Araneus ventricosus TaxID=182803 RepID=A0A4Y2L1C5_ARAVE|nr:hypothetical protein AVEN_84240-1 [Araneus ventricosus]